MKDGDSFDKLLQTVKSTSGRGKHLKPILLKITVKSEGCIQTRLSHDHKREGIYIGISRTLIPTQQLLNGAVVFLPLKKD